MQLRTDDRREQRHGPGGKDPELELRRRIRLGRREHQRGHQERQLEDQREPVRLRARLAIRSQRSLELDCRRREADEPVHLSGRQHWRPDAAALLRLQRKARQAVLLVRARGAAPGRGLGQSSQHHLQRGRAERRSERVPGQSRPESESPGRRADSRPRFSARAHPRPTTTSRRMSRRSAARWPICTRCRTTRIRTTATTTSTVPSSRRIGSSRELRFDWNISAGTKAYIRIARDREDTEGPRGPWTNSAVRAGVADPRHRHQSRALMRWYRRPGAEPDDDQRGPGHVHPTDA